MLQMFFLLLIGLVSSALEANESIKTIEKAWARPTIATQRMSAAYFSLENTGSKEIEIEQITIDFGKAEIHESKIEDGMMVMQELKSLKIAPSKQIKLQPGGLHVMLIDLKRPLLAGESFDLQLHTKGGKVIKLETTVKPL